MQSLEIVLRARSAKEAFTLGLMLARRYYLALLLAALPLWGLCLTLGAALSYGLDSPLYLLFVLWWFKPLYERPMLMRLSRLIFAQAVDKKAEQRAAFVRGLVAELTYLRLFRAFAPMRQAVNCLEGLRGKEKRERLRFLAGGAESGMNALLLISLLETALLLLGAWLFFDVSLRNIAAFLQRLLYAPEELHLFLALMYVPLSVLVSPVYVSLGFMHYLNFRIISEGWAVALEMQQLAARLMQVFALLLLGAFLFNAQPSYAFDSADVAADKAWVQAQVQGKQGPYGQVRLPAERSSTLPNLPNADFSQAVKWSVIGLAVLFVAWLVYQIFSAGSFALPTKPVPLKEKAVISVAEQAAALQTLAAAKQAAERGELLLAVAIVYAHWRKDSSIYRLPVIASDETESEYLARVQAVANAVQQQFLSELFALWQQGAYAQQMLNQAAVLSLLERYHSLWR